MTLGEAHSEKHDGAAAWIAPKNESAWHVLVTIFSIAFTLHVQLEAGVVCSEHAPYESGEYQ